MPQRGRIGIFNRSYYEEVLVVKVHPEVIYAGCVVMVMEVSGSVVPCQLDFAATFHQHRIGSERDATRCLRK